MNINSEISVLEQILTKSHILIFRVAIFNIIWPISNLIGILIKKIPDSESGRLESLKSEF